MSLDSRVLNYLRPKTGAFGPPDTTGLSGEDAGLIAINFAGADAKEKAAGTVALYSYDGISWLHMNKGEPVTTQTLTMTGGASGSAGSIGAAYSALTAGEKALTGSVIIGTWGTPTAGAFLLTNTAAPTMDGSWTPLGSATAIANTGEITAGTDNAKMITPKGLRDLLAVVLAGIPTSGSATSNAGGAAATGKLLLLNTHGLVAPTALPFAVASDLVAGTAHDKIVAPKELTTELHRVLKQSIADIKAATVAVATGGTSAAAGKIVLLNADGKIAANMLSLGGLHFLGSTDMKSAVPAVPARGFQNGDVYTHSHTGDGGEAVPDASWHFAAEVLHVEMGDMAIYDGTSWHHIATAADLTTAMLKTHSNLMSKDGKLIWGDSHAGAALAANTVVIDGGNALLAIMQNMTIKASIIQCGTF